MSSLKEKLNQSIEGEVYFDSMTCSIYSVDASIFEVKPLGVIIPKNLEDLKRTVALAHKHHTPLTMRGAATGITGGCLGKGLILDTSKYLNKILTLNLDHHSITCQPGVIQDDLNAYLAPYGYRLGPDTSTGNRSTLGGMLCNNSAGARSLKFGRMVDHILEVELLLSNGQILTFGEVTLEEWKQKNTIVGSEGEIYRTAWNIKEKYKEEIKTRFPNIPRRVSGYNLDELLAEDRVSFAKLIAGSGGTLGIVTSMTLRIVPQIKSSAICLLHFDDLLTSMKRIKEILAFKPIALELIDDKIIEFGRSSPSLKGQLEWLIGYPKAILVVEFDGEDSTQAREKAEHASLAMKKMNRGYSPTVICGEDVSKVWGLRKSGLGILLSKRTFSRAIAFIEDFSVSPDRLGDFMEEFLSYLESKGKKAGIYGHIGSGCMHVRPYIDLRQPEELTLMQQMMVDVAELLLKYGGALSGEHGDGLIRSWLLPTMFGEKIMTAFRELKQAFDPFLLMNPGKIVDSSFLEKELRLTPAISTQIPKLFLNYTKEGGFDLAVDLCNGNAQCRKKEGVMCPSFQVTQEEFHSTRARAQALRSIIHGRLPMEDLTSQGMYDVMDLCLSCKGCKTECPSQVDMAKMKAEFLYHYQEKQGYSLRNRLFGGIGQLSRWASPMAALFNKIIPGRLFKFFLGYFKITDKRTLPLFAKTRFSKWFKGHRQKLKNNLKVVLFNDTFNEFNEPQIGQSAIKLLNALGFEVLVPEWSCCGRPAFSKGMLLQAKDKAKKVIDILHPFALEAIPIIGLEPSCLFMIKDDYLGLFSEEDEYLIKAKEVSKKCVILDEFLSDLMSKKLFNLSFNKEEKTIKVHGHCHQKALVGMNPTMELLRKIPGFKVTEIASGCCGMAGSFGYEKEHYEISMQIGALALFPAVKTISSDTLIIANGTSCRHQIQDGVGKKAQHLAEVLANHLSGGY